MYGLKLSMMDHTGTLRATLPTANLCAADAQETARLVVDKITRMRNEQDVISFLRNGQSRSRPTFTIRTIFTKKTKSSQ